LLRKFAREIAGKFAWEFAGNLPWNLPGNLRVEFARETGICYGIAKVAGELCNFTSYPSFLEANLQPISA
jgi:hypothetical protein